MKTEPSFYELANRLHVELVDYYGGELPLFMAIQEPILAQARKDMATFCNPNPEDAMGVLVRALTLESVMTYGLSEARPFIPPWYMRLYLWLYEKWLDVQDFVKIDKRKGE